MKIGTQLTEERGDALSACLPVDAHHVCCSAPPRYANSVGDVQVHILVPIILRVLDLLAIIVLPFLAVFLIYARRQPRRTSFWVGRGEWPRDGGRCQ